MNFDEIKGIVKFQSGPDLRSLASLALSTDDPIIKFMAKSIIIRDQLISLLSTKFVLASSSSRLGTSARGFNYFSNSIEKGSITKIEKDFEGVRVICLKKGFFNNKIYFTIKNKLVILPSYGHSNSPGVLSLYVSIYKKIERILNKP